MRQKYLFKNQFCQRTATAVFVGVVVIAVLLLAKFVLVPWSEAMYLQATPTVTLPITHPTSPSSQPQPKTSTVGAAVVTESQKQMQYALSLYDQGLKLYYNRQFDPALVLFNEALSEDPDCYQAINGKGATYAFLGRYDEGIALIKQAIKLKPDFVYAHFNLGLANELAGLWTPALEAYHAALNLDPKNVWSYYGIASIYGRQGKVEQTITYLKQAIALEADVKDFAKKEKDFNNVKNDPRFQALLK